MRKIICYGALLIFTLNAASGLAQFGNMLYMDPNDSTENVAPPALDTSAYPSIRRRIQDQSFFIKLDTNNIDAYIRRAMLQFQMADFAGSIQDYTKILKNMPNSTEGFSNRGMAYCMLKNFDASISDMNRALAITPDPMSYKLRAVVKIYKKDYSAAISDLDTAINMSPDYADAYSCRAGAYVKMKKYNEAVEDYNKAIFRAPQDWINFCGRSEAKLYLKDYKGVIDDCNKVLELNPTFEEYHFFEDLGLSYENIGDKTNAKLFKDKSIALKKKATY